MTDIDKTAAIEAAIDAGAEALNRMLSEGCPDEEAIAEAILAAALPHLEPPIRADEREKCAKVAEPTDRRLEKITDLAHEVRDLIRLGVEPQHRPEILFEMMQDLVYALRGREDIAGAIRKLAEEK